MNGWDDLSRALDACAEAGGTADFWWRDDDATDATLALDRLLALRTALDVPLALAVIPANARPGLAAVVADAVGAAGPGAVDLLQHGYAHANHRAPGAKKAELGADREVWDIAREIAEGRGRMVELFGEDGWLDVMVPPWNRIDAKVAALLPGLGFHGLTTFRDRNLGDGSEALRVVNTHIDIIDWKGTRAFAGDGPPIAAAIGALQTMRHGSGAPAIGLLSHHLAHDEGCWGFIERFVAETSAHPAVRWRAARDLFPLPA